VKEEITYFTNQRNRMRYDEYRACGYQIGSGTVESACKRVIGQRLKQAGMIWSEEQAKAVALIRATLFGWTLVKLLGAKTLVSQATPAQGGLITSCPYTCGARPCSSFQQSGNGLS
jgi:hypothetical protein